MAFPIKSLDFAEPNKKHLYIVILLGILTAFDPLTIDMYLPAFNSIQKDMKTDISNIELSVSTFFIGMALGQLIYGPLSDRFGRKKPLIGGMILYFASTILCAISKNIQFFILFRILQAFGGCASMVISRAIIRDLFNKKNIAIYLSHMNLIMGIAPIIAPSIGAYLDSYFGWKGIFYFLAISNFICIILVYFFISETNKNTIREIKITNVIKTYYKLFEDKKFIGYLIPDISIRAAMFAYIAGSPFVFINIFNLTSQQYGIVFGINGLSLLIASQINKKLLNKFEPEVICYNSVKISFIAALFILIFSFNNSYILPIFVSIFIFLGTLNFISPNSISIALNPYGNMAGTASALYGSLQWITAFFSSFLVSILHNGTKYPMIIIMFIFGTTSLLGNLLYIKQKEFIKKRNSS